ncbi:hypothetical protein BV22DRAFT_988881, partial [Leucogyrophana mollusca]
LSLRDLFALQSTNSRLRSLVQAFKSTRWDINALFSKFFSDPLIFRRQLYACDAIVSGSQVVQFFANVQYPDSDLDIFLCLEGALPMARWLTANGYLFQPASYLQTHVERFILSLSREFDLRSAPYKPRYLDEQIIAVLNFYKHIGGIQTMKVQIIIVPHNPIRHVLDFHSTLVMNFIAWDRAVSIFPNQSFVDNCSFVAHLSKTQYPTPRWSRKWANRGYRMV